jgi:hypothetical protein
MKRNEGTLRHGLRVLGPTAIAMVVFTVLGLTVSSCGDADATTKSPRTHAATTSYTDDWGEPDGFWHGDVDGVECIVVYNDSPENMGANGISCNWSNR